MDGDNIRILRRYNCMDPTYSPGASVGASRSYSLQVESDDNEEEHQAPTKLSRSALHTKKPSTLKRTKVNGADIIRRSPLEVLNNRYLRNVSSQFTNELVSYVNEDGYTRQVWHSVFVCPISGVGYPSGRLRGNSTSVQDVPGGKVGTNFYISRKDAQRAAAACALDAFGDDEPLFCECETQSDPEQIPIPSSDTAIEEASLSDKKGLTPHEYYMSEHNLTIFADNYVAESIWIKCSESKNFVTAWTSMFTCPLSGTQYPSGTVYNSDEIVAHNRGKEETRVFYTNKRSAELAASMFALDVILFQQKGILRPRHCIEDPSLFLQRPDSVVTYEHPRVDNKTGTTSDHDEVISATEAPESPDLLSKFLSLTNDDSIQDSSDSIQDSSDSIRSLDIVDETIDRIDLSFVNDEAEGDVSMLPNSLGMSPAHRLLAASFGTVGQAIQATADRKTFASPLRTIAKQPETIVLMAETWLANNSEALVNGNPHRVVLPRTESVKTLLLAKTVLASLADIVQATPLGTSTSIETVAKKILDELWKKRSALPDSDTYTYFLKCIDGSNPNIAAEKAEAIVEAMMSAAKHKSNSCLLPKPNQGTFNALIQITAQLGGISGRYPKHTDADFSPDRQSFLCVLSSCTYAPVLEHEFGGFDRPFVEECINQMTVLATENMDDSLIPDNIVYNAPLRWTGGPQLWAESRPYARYISWDNYEKLYEKRTFSDEQVNEDDRRVMQARAMESWLDAMDMVSASNKEISPNIETYEAVIQAWLRTATRYGLNRAQDLLRKLLKSYPDNVSLTPRLQSFHPVIAAQYHSHQDDSPTNILAWINECEFFSKDAEACLDSRLVEMKLIASVTLQTKLLKHEDDKKSCLLEFERQVKILELARDCSKSICAACRSFELNAGKVAFDDQPVDIRLFLKATRSWENVITLGVKVKEPELISEAVSEMISLFERFEGVTKASKRNNGFGKDGLSAQLGHFVANAQTFLGTLVRELAAHHSKSERQEIMLLIEKMTRAVGEFDEMEARYMTPDEKGRLPDVSQRTVLSRSRVLPDDHFSYQVEKESVISLSRFAFLWQVIKFLDTVSKDTNNISDTVRMCRLVKDVSTARRRATNMSESIDKILDRLARRASSLRREFDTTSNDKPNRVVNKDDVTHLPDVKESTGTAALERDTRTRKKGGWIRKRKPLRSKNLKMDGAM
jgi:hypothetical protein